MSWKRSYWIPWSEEQQKYSISGLTRICIYDIFIKLNLRLVHRRVTLDEKEWFAFIFIMCIALNYKFQTTSKPVSSQECLAGSVLVVWLSAGRIPSPCFVWLMLNLFGGQSCFSDLVIRNLRVTECNGANWPCNSNIGKQPPVPRIMHSGDRLLKFQRKTGGNKFHIV